MKRIFIMVLDSLGIGGALDAYKFGDTGANTLGHIANVCSIEQAKKKRIRKLYLPNLSQLGLGKAAESSSGVFPKGLDKNAEIIASYGYAGELSKGKDTLSGHWEIAGIPVLSEWGCFKKKKIVFL